MNLTVNFPTVAEIAQDLILFGAVISALFLVLKPVLKMAKEWDCLKLSVAEMNTNVAVNRRDTLKLMTAAPYLSLDERIESGEEYIERGGNGSVKQMVYDMIDQKLHQCA